MKKINSLAITLAVAGAAQMALAQSHTATGTVDRSFYGAPLSIQTINTGFGDSTSGDGTSGGGSELDAAYGTIANNTLFLFFSGNFQNNGNRLDIFLADGRAGGQNTLSANTANGTLSKMNGSVFSPGFNATYAIDANVSGTSFFVDQYDLTTGAGNFFGSLPMTGGITSNQNFHGLAFGVNNTNAAGVNKDQGTAADQNAATAVATGIEIGIPLTSLGSPSSGNILVMADINGSKDDFLSNQFLPGLAVGTNNLGNNGVFNLSSTPNEYFSIPVPASGANGTWINPGSGSWGIAQNWANSVIPGAAGDPAIFASATSPSTVTLDGNRTVGSLSFNNSNTYTIAAGTGGTLTLSGNGSNAAIHDFGGSHIVSASLSLASNTDVDVTNHGDNLTFSGNISGPGQLSVNNLGFGGGNFPDSAIVLSGNNSFQGGLLISGGNLQLGSDGALPAGTSVTFDAREVPSPTLDLNGHNALLGVVNTVTGVQTTIDGAQAIITNNVPSNVTVTFAGGNASTSLMYGSIRDNNAATTSLHIASGALTLQGDSSYNGTTSIDSGAALTVNSFLRPDFTLGPGLPVNNAVVDNGALNISGAASTLSTVTGTGNLTISGNVVVSASTISQHSLTINDTSHVALNSGGTVSLSGLTVGDNSPATSAQLDLNDGSMVLSYTGASPIATIRGLLSAGFNNGSWDGNGIASTASHNDTTMLHALGYADAADLAHGPLIVAGGSIEVKYTLYGDNNLDGSVTAADFQDFLNGFANAGSTWFQGDYTYDGKVDLGNDFNLFLRAYLNTGGSLGALVDVVQTSSLSNVQKASLLSVIPEPSTITMLAIGAGAMAARRRRK
jgi:autotransporter-associated beta strand protein